MKKYLGWLAILAFLLSSGPALAGELSYFSLSDTTFTFNNVSMPSYFYRQTFDNLVLDFSLNPTIIDYIDNLVVKNQGTARYGHEIDKVVLWRDDGNNQFDGFRGDTWLADAEYDANFDVYLFSNIKTVLSLNSHFYVTVETLRYGTRGHTFQFAVPAYNDTTMNNTYNSGDTGIYLVSGSPLPDHNYVNESYAEYSSYSYDFQGPVSVISNLVDGQVLTDRDYWIDGKSRDQGGSNTDKLEICFNGECSPVINLTSFFGLWEYQWTPPASGIYRVILKSTDGVGNSTQTDPVSVTVNFAPKVSMNNSAVNFSTTSLPAAGDKIAVMVTVRDQYSEPLANQKVDISASDTNVLFDKRYGSTNEFGQIIFSTWSRVPGTVDYRIFINGDEYRSAIRVNYTTPVPEPLNPYMDGIWVKITGNPAVYFLDKNNVRHAYPTQAVWESYFGQDFSSVQVIASSLLESYSLGKNVPFKTGTLMKIPSVPKVYEVGEDGALYWVPDEVTAKYLYGTDWSTRVRSLPESFFYSYQEMGVLSAE
jgi:hypothetical protein